MTELAGLGWPLQYICSWCGGLSGLAMEGHSRKRKKAPPLCSLTALTSGCGACTLPGGRLSGGSKRNCFLKVCP